MLMSFCLLFELLEPQASGRASPHPQSFPLFLTVLVNRERNEPWQISPLAINWAKDEIAVFHHVISDLGPQIVFKIILVRWSTTHTFITLHKLAEREIFIQELMPTQIHLEHTSLLHIVPVILALYLNYIIIHSRIFLRNLLQEFASVVLESSEHKLNCNVRLGKVEEREHLII